MKDVVTTPSPGEPTVALDVWTRSFDRLYRRSDELYHRIARGCGVSDACYWLMYAIYTCGGSAPVSYLNEECGYPKQTVSSALGALERKGYVSSDFVAGSRKAKLVSFTEEGGAFAAEKIVPANRAERRAFKTLDESEQAEMLRLVNKYVAAIEGELAAMEGEAK